MDSSSKRNKNLNQSARKSSAKKNTFGGDSSDFPIRHLTKSEYMKVRNIPLLEPDIQKNEDFNPSTNLCQPTTNPKKFLQSNGIHESPKKKGADVFESPQNNLGAEKELQEEKKINKKLKDDLHKSVNEKDDLLKQIKQLDHDHNIYHEKLQDSYEQKLHHLKEDLENSKNNSKGQEEYITHNKLLRKDNEALLKENRELKNFKENTLAENHPEKTKSLLEEKDRRFKNLEILFNNEKENNEIMKERNRQLINENKILQEKPLTHEKDNSEILHEKIKQLANENHILKPKIYELESILTEKSHPNKEVQENLTILSTEINRLQFLIKEKEQQYEKEMKDRENKHMKDLKDKDLKHEKEILDLKKNIQPALKFEIEKELKEVADHFNERKNLYEAEIKQLKSKIADLEDKNLDFRAKLEKFHLATPELVKENELWRRKHADIEKDYKEKSQELNDLKNLDHENLDLLKSNLDQTRKKENGLLNELLILQQALQEKDREINVLKAKNQNQGNQIEQILNENNKKTQDAINLDKKCKELLNELNALKSSHPLINEERKKEFNDRIKDLEGKITLMINENQRLTDLIKEKATENEYIAKILRDKLDENDHLKTLLAQNQNKNMNYEAMKNDLENKKNREIDAAVKDLKYRCMQDKAEYDKEIARLMVILNDLQRKLQEKDEELNSLKKQEENLKKSPNKPNNQFYEDENKFLQQEKRNLEGKIMQLLSENDKIKRKFDDVLQDNSANKIGHKDLLSTSPIKQKPDLDLPNQLKSAFNKITDLEDKLQNNENEKQKLLGILNERAPNIQKPDLGMINQLKGAYNKISDLEDKLQNNEKEKQKLIGILNERSPNKQQPDLDSLNQIKGALNRINDLEDKLQNNEKEKQKLIGILGEKQRENEILNSKLNLSEQLRDKEHSEMIRQLENNIQEHAKRATPQEMNKLGNKMNDLEKQVGQLEKELQDKNRVLKKMADELEKVLSQKNEDPLKENDYQSCFEENVKLESAKTALEGEIFKLDQKILDFQNHNQMLKGDISKLEDKNHLKEKENEEMKSKLFKIEEKQIKELDDFRKQIDNYKKQNMDIKEFNMKFASEKENHENQLNMLNKIIENKDKELEKIYNLLNLRKKELENLTREINDLKNEKLALSLNSSRFNSIINPEMDSVKQVKTLVGENEELQKLLMHYKNQSEKKDKEYMKKSQEIENKIQNLENLRTKYLPENNPKIRYYSPTPSRGNNTRYEPNLPGLKLNFDYNS